MGHLQPYKQVVKQVTWASLTESSRRRLWLVNGGSLLQMSPEAGEEAPRANGEAALDTKIEGILRAANPS